MSIQRSEISDYVTYAETRDATRERIFAVKHPRRIHVGDYLTFLFENAETLRYQIHEMLLAEKIVKEADIQHEIDTYSELLGGSGELGCTLLIEIEDAEARPGLLRAWVDLPKHLYAKLADGTKIRATFDERQIGDDRLSSVQYLKFNVGGQVPIAMGSDLPALTVETALSDVQRAALGEDLG